MPMLLQRIHLTLMPCVTFHNKLVLWWLVSLSPNPQAGRPPLVSSLWLFI